MEQEAAAAGVLRRAEERLRAAGLTGAQAFDALEQALAQRSGEGSGAHPVAAAAVAELPEGPVDVLGLAYERFFADLFKGKRGQYFTPPPIVGLLGARLSPRSGQRLLDPAAGSGGLLRSLARPGMEVEGIERDPRLASLARRVLSLAGVPATVWNADMFLADPEPADIVVANPPFSVRVDDAEVLARWGCVGPTSSDRLFARALGTWVVPGGRAAIVMPLSLVANGSWAAERAELDQRFQREAVLALPEGVFRPFGGAAGRAALVWLRRRHPGELGLPLPMAWAELSDPGYDPRSIALKPTSGDEVAALAAGRGWRELGAGRWAPQGQSGEGRALSTLVDVRRERHPGGPTQRLDLADVDRVTKEARPVAVDELPRGRWAMTPGDLLVSRLRPELGNVVVAPVPAAGSPEWVVLSAPRYGHYLWLYLRTAAWRAQLPLSGGQTRPRVRADDVLATSVRWPGDALAADVSALAEELVAERRRLQERLEGLARAVARFADDGNAEALSSALDLARGNEAL